MKKVFQTPYPTYSKIPLEGNSIIFLALHGDDEIFLKGLKKVTLQT